MTCIGCGKRKLANKYLRCKSCAQNTVHAKLRNRASGRKGGLAAGIIRRKYAITADYKHGYNAGWIAGRRAGYAEALGEGTRRREL